MSGPLALLTIARHLKTVFLAFIISVLFRALKVLDFISLPSLLLGIYGCHILVTTVSKLVRSPFKRSDNLVFHLGRTLPVPVYRRLPVARHLLHVLRSAAARLRLHGTRRRMGMRARRPSTAGDGLL